MTGWLPSGAADLFGAGARASEEYGVLTVDVPTGSWQAALTTARSQLGCRFFDWLSAVDEPGSGFQVCAHVVALRGAGVPPARLLLRTTLPHADPVLSTATGVYPGAAWHERETHEMFGIGFTGHPHLVPLLLPETFEGHPLRKDFVLAARVAKAWPGAKEPGEAGHGGPRRRQMLPPGVPDPNEWGPLKGQLPDAPPPRRARKATASRPADRAPQRADRPRRTRSASGGSASQRAAAENGDTPPADGGAAPPARGDADAPWRAPRTRADRPDDAGGTDGDGAGGAADAGGTQGPDSADRPAEGPRDAATPAAPPDTGVSPETGAEPETGAGRGADGEPETGVSPETDGGPETGAGPEGPARREGDG